MAGNFYTVDEAAEKLGVSPDEVRQMAADQQLQALKNDNKLVFKREEVDALVIDDSISLGDTDAGGSALDLTDSSEESALGLKSDSTASGATGVGGQSGIDVFKPDEVDAADPMAQTQVTSSPGGDDDDLAFDSIGSGSGLLDLTRESDDTSLGAELLDEIKPGGETDDSLASGIGATGAFDTAAMETGASGPSGLENLSAVSEGPELEPVAGGGMAMSYAVEEADPAGNGLGAGMLVVCMASLIVGLLVAVSAIQGVSSGVIAFLSGSSTNYFLVFGGLAVLAIIAGGVGLFVGKAMDR